MLHISCLTFSASGEHEWQIDYSAIGEIVRRSCCGLSRSFQGPLETPFLKPLKSEEVNHGKGIILVVLVFLSQVLLPVLLVLLLSSFLPSAWECT